MLQEYSRRLFSLVLHQELPHTQRTGGIASWHPGWPRNPAPLAGYEPTRRQECATPSMPAACEVKPPCPVPVHRYFIPCRA